MVYSVTTGKHTYSFFLVKVSCNGATAVLDIIIVIISFFSPFSSAATAAESSKSASVCSGAAWPPDRHTPAVRSVHHLTDTAGPTG